MKPALRVPVQCFGCQKAFGYVTLELIERGKRLAGLGSVPASMVLAQIVSLGEVRCPSCEKSTLGE